jgi:hypothetical protein
MNEETQKQLSELEREERRLERLRLVVVPHPDPWEAADEGKGSAGSGRFPQRGPEPEPQQAA